MITPGIAFAGVDNNVFALTASGSDVYIGGAFLYAFGQPGNGIVRWNSSVQDDYTLGNSTNGDVFAVAIDGADVYVGGEFNSAGGIPANNIAKWNSISDTWSALGPGLSGCNGNSNNCYGATVWTIAVVGNRVYVGGDFEWSGSIYNAQFSIAYWDKQGGYWGGVDGGVSGCADLGFGCDAWVYAIVPYGSGVMAAGSFTTLSPNISVGHVGYYDGLTWHEVTDGFTNGTDGNIYALYNDGFGVWMGGGFNNPRPDLVYFDGSSWNTIGSAITNGAVYTITEALGPGLYWNLYIGGDFINAGPNNVSHIARAPEVVGGDWQPLGSGLDGSVNALAWSGTDLIAGGLFTSSGLVGLNRIGRWNTLTNTWSAIGSGADDTIYSLATGYGTIYASGIFHNAGPGIDDFFARWAQIPTYLPLMLHP